MNVLLFVHKIYALLVNVFNSRKTGKNFDLMLLRFYLHPEVRDIQLLLLSFCT